MTNIQTSIVNYHNSLETDYINSKSAILRIADCFDLKTRRLARKACHPDYIHDKTVLNLLLDSLKQSI